MKPAVATARTVIVVLTTVGLLCAAALTPEVKDLLGESAGIVAKVGLATTAIAGALNMALRKLEDAGVVRPLLKREPPAPPAPE